MRTFHLLSALAIGAAAFVVAPKSAHAEGFSLHLKANSLSPKDTYEHAYFSPSLRSCHWRCGFRGCSQVGSCRGILSPSGSKLSFTKGYIRTCVLFTFSPLLPLALRLSWLLPSRLMPRDSLFIWKQTLFHQRIHTNMRTFHLLSALAIGAAAFVVAPKSAHAEGFSLHL